MSGTATLVLRLTAPMQAWGTQSRFNRRETDPAPSKAGILGLLSAAQGRRRQDPIEDLLELRLGIRIDEPGTLLRDYHTVSDSRGLPLLSAATNASGRQKPTSSKKPTHVTERYYLQDALFVAAVGGRRELIESLADAVRRPIFPLALGRRACAPAMPVLVLAGDEAVHDLDPATVLATLPWQASQHRRRMAIRWGDAGRMIRLATIVDAAPGEGHGEIVADVPVSFDPRHRGYRTRYVVRGWVTVPTGVDFPSGSVGLGPRHDPFALLGT